MTSFRHALPSGNQLQVFEAAARRESFSKAAIDLNVTQAAVSRMIRRTEDYLDFDLFVRSPTGISLTPEGARLHKVLSRSFNDIVETIDDIKKGAAGGSSVLLSVSSAFVTHWLMPRIGLLRDAHPNIDLQFQLIDGEPFGSLGVADIGVRLKGHEKGDVLQEVLVPEIVFPVCSPDYASRIGLIGKGGLSRKHTLIRFSNPRIPWSAYLNAFNIHRSAELREISFSDYSIVVQAALAGEGIALGWAHIVAPLMAKGHLVSACSSKLSTGRHYTLVRRNNNDERQCVKDLFDWIINEARK